MLRRHHTSPTVISSRRRDISHTTAFLLVQRIFSKRKVIPLSLETTGALKPWAIPDDQTIIDIWNLVFGMEHLVEDGDVECESFLVAKTLVGDSSISM